MAIAQTIWGIDVGRCALKAIRVRMGSNGKVDVLAAEHIEHAKILTQPDADRTELIGAALEKFLSRSDISKDQVVVSVPGQHTLSRFSKLPPVAPKRIPDIVRYEADQQIPFDMDEVIWDYQTFQDEDSPDIEVGIFAMKRELIREHLLHFEQASIEPIAVQAGPLAVYNAAHFDGLLAADTTILLDLGAESTDLVIATLHNLWTRTIPIGGNNFTEALVKSFKLSFSKAENLKRTAGTSKYTRQIFQAMRPVFADLVQELQRSIGFYSSTHRDSNVERVVGVGNALKLPGLQKYLQQNLGLPVVVPKSFNKLAPVEGAQVTVVKEELLSFAVAYGLALQGLEATKVNTNLLPAEIAKQVVWRKKRPAFGAAAACLLLAGGLIWSKQSADLRSLAAAAESGKNVNVSEDNAWQTIVSPLSNSMPHRAKTMHILQAGGKLQEIKRNLAEQGRTEEKDTEQLIAMQRNKIMIPMLLQVIHESVPVPEGPLGQAATQAEVLKAIAQGAAPRGQRKQVLIDELDMQFEPDLNELDWGESLVDVEPPINDPESPDLLPGILIRIKCRTPHQGGGQFISDTFMTRLRENGRRPGTGFYFDRVYLIEGGKVAGETAYSPSRTPTHARRTVPGRNGLSGGGKGFPGGGGKGFRPGGGPMPETKPAPVAVDAGSLDAVTLEPFGQDWQFEIWVDAILQDYVEPETDEDIDRGEGE